MATVEVNANREIEAEPRVVDYVVDADVHVTPPPTMWAEYLSPEFRHLAPTVETEGDVDYIVFEGQRKQVHLMQSQAGRKTDEYKNVGKFSDMRQGGWLASARVDDMDRDGMDKAILFGGGPLQTGNLDLFFDSFNAFNRWQSDFCSYAPDRLFSASFLPTVDVPTTVKMMKEAKKRGDVAVNIPAFPQSINKFTKMSSIWQAMTGDADGERQYRDPEFDPIWAAAEDLDLAITFHLGARQSRYKDKTNFLPDIPMGKVAMLEMVSIMLYGGVFDRFPKLRIGLIESGCGWIPWAAEYMDRTWDMQRHWTECNIKHPPSYYFDQNVYASFISDRIGIELFGKPGCKNIMWSSDYPHSETTFPHSHKSIASNFEGMPAEDVNWIVAGCAEKFFGLK